MNTHNATKETTLGATSIQARPHAVSFDLNKTAVIVVDMQNDFGAENGMFHRAGIDISMIQAAVAPTVKVLTAAKLSRIPIIYLKMGFHADLSNAGSKDSPNYMRHQMLGVGAVVQAPDDSTSRILIRDTWNTDILTALAPQPEDIVLYKHRFSGFYETELDTLLKQRDIKHLIVTGCTTSVCVDATIRDAMYRDYSCILLEDCTGEPIGNGMTRSNHDASLLTIEVLLGWVSSSEEFIRALAQ